jgi:hypothetical protein
MKRKLECIVSNFFQEQWAKRWKVNRKRHRESDFYDCQPDSKKICIRQININTISKNFWNQVAYLNLYLFEDADQPNLANVGENTHYF